MNGIIACEGRGFLRISGDDHMTFLQNLITQDVYKAGNSCIYSLLLTPQGKFLFDFFIFTVSGALIIDANKTRLMDLKTRLGFYKLRAKVEIEEITDMRCGFSQNFSDAPEGSYVFPDPRKQGFGYRVYYSETGCLDYGTSSRFPLPFTGGARGGHLSSCQSTNEPENYYHAARIAAMIPEGDYDMIPDKSFPLEYGMDALNAIDFNKGCFIGQEVTARTKHRGVVRKGIFLVEADRDLPPSGAVIKSFQGNEIGVLCSTSGKVGLALLRKEEVIAAAASGGIFLDNGLQVTARQDT